MGAHPLTSGAADLHVDLDFDPYRASTIERLIEAWLPLTYAVTASTKVLDSQTSIPLF
jgi:hypothetical protein